MMVHFICQFGLRDTQIVGKMLFMDVSENVSGRDWQLNWGTM